jgi:CIC family chloride channel protein
MLGGVFGRVLTEQFPGVAGPEGAYVLVGIAAVFAAAAQAPMTSILIVFEMTNDYRIMLALMMACVTSTLVYGALKQDSIYMVKLRRKASSSTRVATATCWSPYRWRGCSCATSP